MDELLSLTTTKKSGVRTTVNDGITSIICQEYLYKSGKLPVLARGLFMDSGGKIFVDMINSLTSVNCQVQNGNT